MLELKREELLKSYKKIRTSDKLSRYLIMKQTLILMKCI